LRLMISPEVVDADLADYFGSILHARRRSLEKRTHES
jgi:hypothetical protein